MLDTLPATFVSELPAAMPPVTPEAIGAFSTQALLGWFCLILIGGISTLFAAMQLRSSRHEHALKERDAAHAAELKAAHDAMERLRTECSAQIASLQEARLTLMRETVTQLGSATAAIQLNAQENAERTKTISDLVRTIAELISKTDASRAHFMAVAEELKNSVRGNGATLQGLGSTLATISGALSNHGRGSGA